MDVYRTANVPPSQRETYWSSLYGEKISPLNVSSEDGSPVRAELRLGAVGPLRLADLQSTPLRAERTVAQSRAVSRREIGFIVTLEGEGTAVHCRNESLNRGGDILISDETEPMVCDFRTPVKSIVVRADESAVRARMPFLDHVRGVRLPGECGLAPAAAAMAKFLRQTVNDDTGGICGASLASQFLDTVALAYASGWEKPIELASASEARYALARQFFEGRLANPDLRPDDAARALNISPRYLRLLMAERGETASSYILRRRLEECAKQLRSPQWRGRTITELAFSWGFNSTAHFARVFKERFGASPRDYRRAEQ